MDRTEIRAAVVNEIDSLLAEGRAHEAIAALTNVTAYVVGVIAADTHRSRRPQPRDLFERRVSNPCRGTDAATIRMAQRMLEVGVLNQRDVARELGVSPHLIERVAAGQRVAVSSERPFVFKDLGERFEPKPVRCGTCGMLVSIVPCRACRAMRS